MPAMWFYEMKMQRGIVRRNAFVFVGDHDAVTVMSFGENTPTPHDITPHR